MSHRIFKCDVFQSVFNLVQLALRNSFSARFSGDFDELDDRSFNFFVTEAESDF